MADESEAYNEIEGLSIEGKLDEVASTEGD
jgi:hypothetical protein